MGKLVLTVHFELRESETPIVPSALGGGSKSGLSMDTRRAAAFAAR